MAACLGASLVAPLRWLVVARTSAHIIAPRLAPQRAQAILMFTRVFAAMAILSFLLLVVVGVGFVHRSRTSPAGYALVAPSDGPPVSPPPMAESDSDDGDHKRRRVELQPVLADRRFWNDEMNAAILQAGRWTSRQRSRRSARRASMALPRPRTWSRRMATLAWSTSERVRGVCRAEGTRAAPRGRGALMLRAPAPATAHTFPPFTHLLRLQAPLDHRPSPAPKGRA